MDISEAKMQITSLSGWRTAFMPPWGASRAKFPCPRRRLFCCRPCRHS